MKYNDFYEKYYQWTMVLLSRRNRVSDILDDSRSDKLAIKYLNRIGDFLNEDRPIKENSNIEIDKIYPTPVKKLFKQNNMKKMRQQIIDVLSKIGNLDDDVERLNCRFGMNIILIFHMILRNITLPVMYVVAEDVWKDGMDFNDFGFSKSEFNKLKLLLDIIDVDMKKFIKEESVSKDKVELIEKYTYRLLQNMTGSTEYYWGS